MESYWDGYPEKNQLTPREQALYDKAWNDAVKSIHEAVTTKKVELHELVERGGIAPFVDTEEVELGIQIALEEIRTLEKE
jgi:hypothetical protein